MSQPLEVTVGDTGVTVSGTFTQLHLGSLANMNGVTVTFTLLRPGNVGNAFIAETAAVLGTFTAATNSVAVSYQLKAADVASAISSGQIRWALTLSDGTKIHGPSAVEAQTFLKINP